jgi:hypothetical protein
VITALHFSSRYAAFHMPRVHRSAFTMHNLFQCSTGSFARDYISQLSVDCFGAPSTLTLSQGKCPFSIVPFSSMSLWDSFTPFLIAEHPPHEYSWIPHDVRSNER